MTISDFQTSDGLFTIAAFDHRASLAKSMDLDLGKPEDKEQFKRLKAAFMKHLSPFVSAALTDPEYGLDSIKEKAEGSALFLSLEKSGYSDDHDEMTELYPNWGFDQIASHGAGAKILVYCNSNGPNQGKKYELIKRLSEESRAKGVVFLVEPVIYALRGQELKEWSEPWVEMFLSVCGEISPYCDILKVQYPGNAQACEQVTRMHPNWVLLSRGVEFEDFSRLLKDAVSSGCRGYAAGRAVWQDLIKLKPDEWDQFLSGTAVERLKTLTNILKENVVGH